jgi:hypothetical protein
VANSFYRRKEWMLFREKCLARVGYKCERCAKPGILQVHHPEYVAGKKPWEYEMKFCEVLCRGCHAGEHGLILPREGWTILYSDLENNAPSDPVPCANCGLSVTWHFVIYHPDWGEAIVGSECAENLSLGEEVAHLKSQQRRMRTFVHSPRWNNTPSGSWILQDQQYVLIFRAGGKYRIRIDDQWGKFDYPDLETAKMHVFAVLERRRQRRTRK